MWLRIRNIFAKNFFWKLSSLGFAFLLWFFVINIENPNDSRLYPVKLEIKNIEELYDKNIAVMDSNLKNLTVNIMIKGTRLSLDELDNQKKSLQAWIDFSKSLNVSQDTLYVSVETKLPPVSGVYVDYLSPSGYEFKIEALNYAEKKLEMVARGELAEGFVHLDPIFNPDSIRIHGAESVIKSVHKAIVYVDLNGDKSDLEIEDCKPVFLDDKNKQLFQIDYEILNDAQEIHLTLPVRRAKKINIVAPEIIGNPKANYGYQKTELSKDSLHIVGKQEDLDQIEELILPPIDVENRSKEFEKKYQLADLLPPNIQIENSEASYVTVTVFIEELEEKILRFTPDMIGIDKVLQDKEWKILSVNGDLTIKGSKVELETITSQDLLPFVITEGLSAGLHDVQLQLKIPESITLLSDAPYVTISIQDLNKQTETISDSE